MSLNYFSEEFLIGELDLKGQNLSLFKEDSESSEDFRKRLVSCYRFLSSNSSLGIANTLCRELGTYPKYIGYIKKTYTNRISFTGNNLEIRPESDYTSLVKRFTGLEGTTIGDLKTYLEDASFAEVELNSTEFLDKNINFLLPFDSHNTLASYQANTGIFKIPEGQTTSAFLIKNNNFLKHEEEDIDYILKPGDWVFDSSRQTLYTFEGKTPETFTLVCETSNEYIPLFYCPVSVLSYNQIITDEKIKESAINLPTTVDSGTNPLESNPLYNEIFWELLNDNPGIWKENNGPNSVKGRYAS